MNSIKYTHTFSRLGLIILLLTLIVSCEKTTYQSRISIKNETNSVLTIKLFPKNGYYSPINMYRFSDTGSGHRDSEFQLNIGSEIDLFTSKNFNAKPTTIAHQIFSSIHILQSNENDAVIKFSEETVIGYAENLYSDDSLWDFELQSYDLPTQFQSNPHQCKNYTFVILQDKFNNK